MVSRNKKITAVCVFLITIAVLVIIVFNMGITAAVSDTTVRISGFWYTERIDYEDIAEINIYTGFEYGSKQSGMGIPGTYRGIYKNDALGEYEIAANKDDDSLIVVKKTDGKYYVFNCGSREQTSQIYNFIKNRVE